MTLYLGMEGTGKWGVLSSFLSCCLSTLHPCPLHFPGTPRAAQDRTAMGAGSPERRDLSVMTLLTLCFPVWTSLPEMVLWGWQKLVVINCNWGLSLQFCTRNQSVTGRGVFWPGFLSSSLDLSEPAKLLTLCYFPYHFYELANKCFI